MLTQPQIVIAGENSLIVYLAEHPSQQSCNDIAQLGVQIKQRFGEHLIDITPSYVSLLVTYNALEVDYFYALNLIKSCLDNPVKNARLAVNHIRLPVYYDAPSTPDLDRIAQHHGLSKEQVISFHLAQQYDVFAIGFAPGFAFLGEVDSRIALPRLSTPRKNVPTGAVGIADRQTAVYPSNSPGGGNLIGVCPTPLFNPHIEPYMPFKVGDTVEFYRIDETEFLNLGGIL